MLTKEMLEAELKTAMRQNDDLRKRTLRSVLAAVKYAEVEKGAALEPAAVLALVQKEIKARHEARADAERAGRPDLIAAAEAEAAALATLLPPPLSPEELDALAREAVAEAGATSIKGMGAVMKLLTPRLAGRASGEQASAAVRRALES